MKLKTGTCQLCTDQKPKPLIKNLCGYHYKIESQKRQREKRGRLSGKRLEKPPNKKEPTFSYSTTKNIKRTPLKKGNKNAAKDARFRKKVWDTNPHYCEECGIYLGESLRSEFISHIISRGANTYLRSDLRNANVLCGFHHSVWEFGNRSEMNIYKKNLELIQTLKKEYYAK